MGSYSEDWGAWGAVQASATDITATSIANAGDLTSDALSNDGKLDTEISVAIAYGGTATQGVIVYILRDADGTNYEAEGDSPWGFMMPYATSVTKRRVFTVPASIGGFKVLLTNDSGASINATVKYRQATGATA